MKLDGIVVFFSIMACSIIFYYGLSNILKKSILVKGEKVIFSNGPFKYNLDVNKMALYYEKVSVLGGRFKDYYGLVLYRDIDKIFGMSFNNRFVLAYEMDEVKLEIYQKKFKDLLDIEIKVVKAL